MTEHARAVAPRSTYRLQIRKGFDLHAAAELTDYLRDLGVDWAYLSPLLRATSGSDHGYDVTDPTVVDPERGGPEGLERFADAARAAGLGILIDIVPNHQGVSAPRENPWWWDVLRQGQASPHASAFDIDWTLGGGKVRLPILGGELEQAIEDGEIEVDADAGVLRYFDHEFPLAEGTAEGDVREVLARQHYELLFWRRGDEELNYRRFFAVTTLAGVRVEDPAVFEDSHAEILRWVRDGLADGLRVDHPDGLADPGGYLEMLSDATGGAYVLVEKILEHGEELPAWWATDGTTGYDAMAALDRVLIDPAGAEPLARLDADLRGGDAPEYEDVMYAAKLDWATRGFRAEVRRLSALVPEGERGGADDGTWRDAVAELLAAFPVYRAYLPAGREHLDHAVELASGRRPELAGSFDAIAARLVADPEGEFTRRFMQSTGPVMAKGVEDTTFYRWNRLGTLTEVGGDPTVFSLGVDGFHAASADRQASWPAAMTSLSTHDTKRSEDVRARLSVLAEIPDRWAEVLGDLRAVASTGDGPFDTLLWQAIVGAWPASRERLHAYAEKASREAGDSTTWSDPDEAFEERMHAVVDAAFGDARSIVEGFVDEIAALGRSNSLSLKLLQLAGPGVPDVYQGTELWDHSLVDPDNRREVDFAERRRLLARLDEGWMPPVDASGAAKLLVVSRALRLRRGRPELFTRYTPMTVVGEAAEHAVAFDRGGAVAVATRLPAGLARRGGWGDTVLLRHHGPTVDVLTGRRFGGGPIRLADLLDTYPVALLAPADVTEGDAS
ncbi:malto-oligosyltrehalose synthase [Microbacterium sp. EYE_5]|uniref:malto-oligosyltrehalose synthase n=1 Tax=unclassified Microbacterium TaxID=2609290 RepID=UPI0020054BAC|nr:MULTISPECIES: malto-oligosyltrehalose synthase [unclassified Microbacterium]MCK6079908.1 malto-oligosyltrehalose synthase [Microbacterium sp. EYE_382]MCK6085179.1 malto-oligosyltrehalose synthase [Microbacterium sp. EYE_384]MCK6122595.1 malto-oligosyltrehalose synthase [Microbacterium sp. EYE_80]MCK6125942.1 malto-oligosyltrehalose synthase [Microbacterium sp. EYE_79]MCK6140863.1 malto-oligosyltrehalose synthase [Microbacterium sp. EYE_39]